MNNKWESPEYWEGLITSQKWYNVDQSTINAIEEQKTSWTEKISQIGLMYVTDYFNAGSQDTSNWLFIKNGWSTNSTLSGRALYEWTMSRYGLYGSFYRAWNVYSNGKLDYNGYMVTGTFAVRPVFYVLPGVTLTGEGTTENPFIIHS